MSFPRHGQIYQPMYCSSQNGGEVIFGSASTAIGSMSLQLAIPWQVGLHQSLPPLHQPDSFSITGWKL